VVGAIGGERDVVTDLQLVLRLVLGLIFLVSALAKLRDPAAFVRGVLDYRVLPRPLAQVYGWLLPFVEVGTALLLLSGLFPPLAASLAVLILTSFAIAIVVAIMQGREVGCHCFGSAQRRGSVGWHTLLRDLVLLVPSGLLLATAASGQHSIDPWLQGGSRAAAVLILVPALTLCYLLLAEGLDLLASLPGHRSNPA
jgi:uncharacterized membrane protein YphA (DoxX/SURF4 family)